MEYRHSAQALLVFDNNRAAAQSPQPDSFARNGACIMRICRNGPVAVRRGAVCIGAGRDFGHSMEANALVQQTPRGRFGILRRQSPADRLRPDSAPRILPAQTPKAQLASPRLTYFAHIRQCMPSVQQTPRGRFGILCKPSPADRLRLDSAPRIPPAQAPKARLTSPRLTYFVPIRQHMSLFRQTPRGRFGILRRQSPADRLRPDSAPRISPRRAPCALLPPYRSSTSNENTPHCSRPQVSSSVSRTPHARASKSCTRRR